MPANTPDTFGCGRAGGREQAIEAAEPSSTKAGSSTWRNDTAGHHVDAAESSAASCRHRSAGARAGHPFRRQPIEETARLRAGAAPTSTDIRGPTPPHRTVRRNTCRLSLIIRRSAKTARREATTIVLPSRPIGDPRGPQGWERGRSFLGSQIELPRVLTRILNHRPLENFCPLGFPILVGHPQNAASPWTGEKSTRGCRERCDHRRQLKSRDPVSHRRAMNIDALAIADANLEHRPRELKAYELNG